jgi:hypothetical protein
MQQPGFYLAHHSEGRPAHLPDYAENALELLDQPGEWYLYRPAHTLYYIPCEGEDMTAAEVLGPAIETLIVLNGSLEKPVRNICFECIIFSHGGWLRPSKQGHAELQANFCLDPDPGKLLKRTVRPGEETITNVHNECCKSPANIVLHSAHAVNFAHCTFTKLGGAGIDLEHGSCDNVISGCHFHDISGSAIQVGDVLTEDHHPHNERLIVKNNHIVNNYIHDVGVEYEGSVGIFVGYTEDTVIAHNEICNLPYTGASVGWGWGEEDAGGGAYEQPFFYHSPTPARNNRIEYNHIHHVMLRRGDGGGIYTVSHQPGTIIKGNHLHDNKEFPGGIYLDEGSGHIEITENLVYDVPQAMTYNNHAQSRIDTCNEHDNYFDIGPDTNDFPDTVVEAAGRKTETR